MAEHMRLFIAADLPQPFYPVLQQAMQMLQAHAAHMRRTPQRNLHLTMCFLGEVPPDIAQEIRHWFAALPGLCQHARSARIAAYGHFPSRKGHTLWAGLEVTEELTAFVAELARGLKPWVAVDNRKWVPHITLARDAQLTRAMNDLLPQLPVSPPATLPGITLYHSQFTKSGMLYTPLETITE
ncbi:MAG: RNA 2',3'-cyclic phosphodiesterase [Christensenellales bacterium]